MEKLNFTKDYIFHTIQGEGLHTGVPSVFLRLSGCNLRCEWENLDGTTSLCDTPYSSHSPERFVKTIDEVMGDLRPIDCKYIVITGGEPFLQKNLSPLVARLKKESYYVCIETNATEYFPVDVDFLSLSPKLSTSCVDKSKHAKMHQQKRLKIETIKTMCRNHDFQLKFVINTEAEIEEVKEIEKELSDHFEKNFLRKRIMLMPQAVSLSHLEVSSIKLVELCKKYDYRFCDRTHVRLWSDKRGV